MLGFQRNQRNQRPKTEPRGTVLILCVALLVILGMLASGFVIIAHANKGSSRALGRADRFEQVRQMSLAYIQALLLEDLVGYDGIFLNYDGANKKDEAYDAPGSDPWLSRHEQVHTAGYADTDADGNEETDWNMIGAMSSPLSDVIAPDGTQYRVAIRIVDTNGLANINVGMADQNESSGQTWDSKYPSDLDLRTLLVTTDIDRGALLDSGGWVDGRIKGYTGDLIANLDGLYTYLANPNPGTTRPFDVAEELALRMQAGPVLDLHGRLGNLWPNTFYKSLGGQPALLTAYSWTMQIRPEFTQEIEDELINLGYPGPCKIPLNCLFNSDGSINEDGCKAVYLCLRASGMNADDAAQFLVNLVDYIDDDNFSDALPDISVIGPGTTANSIIAFDDWTTIPAGVGAPGSTYYGVDTQPIISEVYSYRYYDGAPLGTVPETYNYTLNTGLSQYAVELYNPTNQAISLDGWQLDVSNSLNTPYALNGLSIPANGFLILRSFGPAGPELIADLSIGAGLQTVTLKRPGPETLPVMVAVDQFEANFSVDPLDGGTTANPEITEDSERPGRTIPNVSDNIPTIASFGALAPSNTLGDYPNATITAGQGGQIILRNGELHSLGELFHVAKVANDGTDAKLIEKMEGQPGGDSTYRWGFGDPFALDIIRRMLQNFTLRTGLNDGFDNDGDDFIDRFDMGSNPASDESIVAEARVPGVININTAPVEVINALHYYFGTVVPAEQIDVGELVETYRASGGMEMVRFMDRLQDKTEDDGKSYDEGDPSTPGVGTPDGITVDNEETLFHFTNVANLIGVRSDVFVVYITIQASDRDGNFANPGATMRTMAIVDRSYCLRPYGTDLKDIPLPRIVAQTRLP